MIAADLTAELDRVEMHMRSHAPLGMCEREDAEELARIARKAIAALKWCEALQERATLAALRRIER